MCNTRIYLNSYLIVAYSFKICQCYYWRKSLSQNSSNYRCVYLMVSLHVILPVKRPFPRLHCVSNLRDRQHLACCHGCFRLLHTIIVGFLSLSAECCRWKEVISMTDNPLIIKKRGEDGTKLISLRIKEDTLRKLDSLAAETNYSRNELINLLLVFGLENVQVKWLRPDLVCTLFEKASLPFGKRQRNAIGAMRQRSLPLPYLAVQRQNPGR